MTGESMPVRKTESARIVYAGTVIEEGEITISQCVLLMVGSKYENIVHMIEESEKLKSSVESKASHLADQPVPYSLCRNCTHIFILQEMRTKALINTHG